MESCIANQVAVEAETIYHYVIVRLDIPPGLRAAQIIHAAGCSGRLAEIPADAHAVALGAKSELELCALEARLIKTGIAHVAIRESDPPYEGRLMAIGCMPLPRERVRKMLSAFPLVRS